MTDLDKMARELLSGGHPRKPGFTVTRRQAERAIHAALLTAPPGYVLVPVEPTPEMLRAAREHHEGEAYLPVSLYRAMLAAAPRTA